MNLKQILLISLAMYVNCQGASKALVLKAADADAKAQAAVDVDRKVQAVSAQAAAGAGANQAKAGEEVLVAKRKLCFSKVFACKRHQKVGSFAAQMPDGILIEDGYMPGGAGGFKTWVGMYSFDKINQDASCICMLKGFGSDFKSAKKLKDGRLIICFKDSMRIFDLNVQDDNKCVGILKCTKGTTSCAEVIELKDGRLVSWDIFKIDVWVPDAQGNYKHNSSLYVPSQMMKVVESADGRLIATHIVHNQISIFTFDQGKYVPTDYLDSSTSKIKDFSEGNGPVVLLADGRLATGRSASHCKDAVIQIWDLNLKKGDDPDKDGRCVAVLRGHEAGIMSLTQLRDGGLASTSYDGTARIWDLKQQVCIQKLEHGSWVYSLAELPDGRLLTHTSSTNYATNTHNIYTWDCSGVLLDAKVIDAKLPELKRYFKLDHIPTFEEAWNECQTNADRVRTLEEVMEVVKKEKRLQRNSVIEDLRSIVTKCNFIDFALKVLNAKIEEVAKLAKPSK